MPSFTKKAIVESFLRIAGKKAPDKITVRDVVDDCGINRNTFYYYFQDIYAVLEEVCANLMAELPKEESLSALTAAYCTKLGNFAVAYPKTVKHLLISLGYDGMDRYFARHLDSAFLVCLARHTGAPRERLERVTRLLKHAVFGCCMDLLRAERYAELSAQAQELGAMVDGMARAFLTQ